MTSLVQILQTVVRTNKPLVIDIVHESLASTSFLAENVRTVFPLAPVLGSSSSQSTLFSIGQEISLTAEHPRDVTQYIAYFKDDVRPYVLQVVPKK